MNTKNNEISIENDAIVRDYNKHKTAVRARAPRLNARAEKSERSATMLGKKKKKRERKEMTYKSH